jgi:hypothetical protein
LCKEHGIVFGLIQQRSADHANYNDALYPIEVTIKVQFRNVGHWYLLIFQLLESLVKYRVRLEQAQPNDCAPINPITNEPYFVEKRGLGQVG